MAIPLNADTLSSIWPGNHVPDGYSDTPILVVALGPAFVALVSISVGYSVHEIMVSRKKHVVNNWIINPKLKHYQPHSTTIPVPILKQYQPVIYSGV